MADQLGISRDISLPDIPKLRQLPPTINHAELVASLRETFVDISRYFDAQRDALRAMHDELAKRSNEFLVESQWPETIKTQITANQNDYSLGDGVVFKISSDAARNITGFATEISDGHHKILINSGGFAITVMHQNAGSVAANRVICLSGADTAVAANGTFKMWHDPTDNRWRQI